MGPQKTPRIDALFKEGTASNAILEAAKEMNTERLLAHIY
jgi:hypothetical protein